MITYIRFDWSSHSYLVPSFIQGYREVFGDFPYNEWEFCPGCNRVWGIEQHTGRVRVSRQIPVTGYQSRENRVTSVSSDFMVCGYCNVALSPFWSEEQVYADLQKQIIPGSSCWLALEGNEVVGFCWGYPIDTGILEQELKLQISGSLQQFCPPSEIVAYLDEVGVRKPYRGRRIASELLRRHLADLNPTLPGVLRTQRNSDAYYWYLRLGYSEIASYSNWDRVILAVQEIASLIR